jgi:hypothetical protein
MLDVLLLLKLDNPLRETELTSYFCDFGDVLSLLNLSLLVHDFLPVRHGENSVGIFQGVSQRGFVIKVGLKLWN